MCGFSTSPSNVRRVCYGYRYGEVVLPKIGPIKKTARISCPEMDKVDLTRRTPVQVDLGVGSKNFALPHPDPIDPITMVAGVRKRVATAPPNFDPVLMFLFKVFVRNWIEKNLVPLAPDTDISFENWINNCNYPMSRKEELKLKWSKVVDIKADPRYFRCKCFQKDEPYLDLKHARGIYSRTDEFKCAVGPTFKQIENVLYSRPEFIKHVPVADRPKYIMDLLDKAGCKYSVTDYTAFESLFVKEIMESCEFQLYDFMTQNLPNHEEFMYLCHRVLGGQNVCTFKHFVLYTEATRMSGEMNTSLGNGFSNLMFMLFICSMKGCTDVVGVVEGDDGLFSFNGPSPTTEDFAKLGLNIKLEIHTDLCTTKFCGLVFDREDLRNVTDILKVLASVGWTSAQYFGSKSSKLKSLLRCKGLSYLHQYPGCPVIQSMSQYILRVTKSMDVRHLIYENRNLSWWDRKRYTEAYESFKKNRNINVPIGINTRFLVEKLYGISVEDQLKIEAYFDNLNDLCPIDYYVIDMYVPPNWKKYYMAYYAEVTKSDPDHPSIAFTPYSGFKIEFELG